MRNNQVPLPVRLAIAGTVGTALVLGTATACSSSTPPVYYRCVVLKTGQVVKPGDCNTNDKSYGIRGDSKPRAEGQFVNLKKAKPGSPADLQKSSGSTSVPNNNSAKTDKPATTSGGANLNKTAAPAPAPKAPAAPAKPAPKAPAPVGKH